MQPSQAFQSSTRDRTVSSLGVDSRAAFIAKTYNHLFGAVLLFTLIEVALFKSGLAYSMADFMLQGSWLIVLGAFMLVSWLARGVAHRSTSRASQYLALGGYVLAQAIIFVPLLVLADSIGAEIPGQSNGIIASAAQATILGFAALTAVVFFTRKDFSFLGAFLGFGGLLALGMILFSVFFGGGLGPWFSAAMVLFAGAAILYDTSKVLHHYPEESYVAASLELFASVALLFWYVIQIFSHRD